MGEWRRGSGREGGRGREGERVRGSGRVGEREREGRREREEEGEGEGVRETLPLQLFSQVPVQTGNIVASAK